jgi:hypothetical protein
MNDYGANGRTVSSPLRRSTGLAGQDAIPARGQDRSQKKLRFGGTKICSLVYNAETGKQPEDFG